MLNGTDTRHTPELQSLPASASDRLCVTDTHFLELLRSCLPCSCSISIQRHHLCILCIRLWTRNVTIYILLGPKRELSCEPKTLGLDTVRRTSPRTRMLLLKPRPQTHTILPVSLVAAQPVSEACSAFSDPPVPFPQHLLVLLWRKKTIFSTWLSHFPSFKGAPLFPSPPSVF